MNTIRVQARLVLCALIATVLVASGTAAAGAANPDRPPSAGTTAEKGALGPANARPGDFRGAIYYDASRDVYGWSSRKGSYRGANRAAYNDCKRNARNCRRVITIRNSCAALAVRYSNGRVVEAAWGYHPTNYRTAVRNARRKIGDGAYTRAKLCADWALF